MTKAFIKGFCQVKKNPKIREKLGSEWVAPTRIFHFFWKCFFLSVFVVVHVSNFFFKWIGGWVGVVWPILVFLGFLDFFKLDKASKGIHPSNHRSCVQCWVMAGPASETMGQH